MKGIISYGGIFDYDQKVDQLAAVARELEDPKVWDNAERAQSLGKEKKALEDVVIVLNDIHTALSDTKELLPWQKQKRTKRLFGTIENDLKAIENKVNG